MYGMGRDMCQYAGKVPRKEDAQGGRIRREYAEHLKNEKYAHLAHQFDFYPIGFERFSSWGPSAINILDKILANVPSCEEDVPRI